MTASASNRRRGPRGRTWTEEATERASRAFAAGAAYAVAIALASWSFAPVRDFASRLGASAPWATGVVAAALLLLLAIAAAAAIRLLGVRDRAGDRLLVGAFGVTLLVAAELVGGPLVRPWGLYETLTRIMPEPSSLFFALLVGAVLTPLLEPIGRPRRRG